MFFYINPAFLIALLFFFAGGGYVYSSFVMEGIDTQSKLRRELLAAVLCVIISCFFYGLMTISADIIFTRICWAIGFTSYILFLPLWVRFTSNMITIKSNIAKFIIRKVLVPFTAVLSVLCVLSGETVFKQTDYGNQFTYNGSLIFKITVIYVFLLCICVFASHIKWWLQSEMKRHQIQQRTFVILTFLFAPAGFATDFFIPAFLDFTITPLVSILLFPASFQLFLSMRADKTLSITVPNVAGYIFKSVNIPTLVLDYQNNICLVNDATAAFLGCSFDNKNIDEFIIVSDKKPAQSFFDNNLTNTYIKVLTASGVRVCEMMLTVERDRFDDAISKTIMLIDITDIQYRDKLLQAQNRAAAFLLNSDSTLFEKNLYQSLETIGKAADIDRIYLCKNHMDGGEHYFTQLCVWYEGNYHVYQPAVDIPYTHFPDGWEALLASEKCINIKVCNVSQKVREHADQYGILSILIVPIFIQEHFWGFVGYNDCHRERVFTQEEETILHSIGIMFVDAQLRFEMESEVEKANTINKLMLDATPLCCELWNSDMQLIDCNEATITFFGVKDKQAYIDGLHYFSPEYQPDGMQSEEKITQCIQKALNEGSFTMEWIHLFDDGSLVPVEVTLVPVLFGKERIVAVYLRDLREAKAAERNMLESMERERDLEIQKQGLQAASDAKTRFLANMSHEIRTPMNAIIGMSDLLLAEDLDIRQHRYAEDIKISSHALLDIINDILDFSKIQAAKLNLVPVHYHFKTFIDNISAMTLSLIKTKTALSIKKQLNFIVDIKSDIPECLYGDDVRFRQVLLNLLSNAVKYSKEGTITLTINAAENKARSAPLFTEICEIRFEETNRKMRSNFLAHENTLHITVSDMGTGIPKEKLATLFDAFEQADIEKNRSVEGTGLGLAITKSLVDLMDGQITVESEYGKGSSFHLTVPLIPGSKELIKKDHEAIEIIHAPEAEILVVDDRETNLSVICGLLHQCHINADAALSGAQAIEMVSQKQYDLIFMDQMMPEMDGIETTQLMREKGVKIPIIALTANAVSGAKELLLSIGMDDFLSKPIDKAELYRILSTWILSEKIVSKQEAEKIVRNKAATPPLLTEICEIRFEETNRKVGSTFLAHGKAEGTAEKGFWDALYTVDGLSVKTGLELASGQRSAYKRTLEIAMREIGGSIKNIEQFLNEKEMKSFCIEVHGIKGSLLLIGAAELSAEALRLENASREGDGYDMDFCVTYLPGFIANLTAFIDALKKVFEILRSNQEPITIPPELPPILTRITDAMANEDFMALYEEHDLLEALEVESAMKDEIESLKGAVMVMNYIYASDIINRLMQRMG